jgi:hypothetical protein
MFVLKTETKGEVERVCVSVLLGRLLHSRQLFDQPIQLKHPTSIFSSLRFRPPYWRTTGTQIERSSKMEIRLHWSREETPCLAGLRSKQTSNLYHEFGKIIR